MKIGILGCGWLGEKLVETFNRNYHQIFVSNRTKEKSKKFKKLGYHTYNIDFNIQIYTSEVQSIFKEMDMIVISVKVSKYADEEQQTKIFTNIANFLKGFTGKVVLFSSTGIYPNVNQKITEKSVQNTQLNSNIYTAETIIQKNLPQANILRLAGLFGDNRKLKNFIKDYSQLKSPNNLVNYVHYLDIINIVERLLYKNVSGEIFNVVAPEHPTKSGVWNKVVNQNSNKISSARIIDGSKLENRINYEYIHKNPINFA